MPLGDARGVGPAVVILHVCGKYGGLRLLLAARLFGLEELEGRLDVVKVIVGVGITRS